MGQNTQISTNKADKLFSVHTERHNATEKEKGEGTHTGTSPKVVLSQELQTGRGRSQLHWGAKVQLWAAALS